MTGKLCWNSMECQVERFPGSAEHCLHGCASEFLFPPQVFIQWDKWWWPLLEGVSPCSWSQGHNAFTQAIHSPSFIKRKNTFALELFYCSSFFALVLLFSCSSQLECERLQYSIVYWKYADIDLAGTDGMNDIEIWRNGYGLLWILEAALNFCWDYKVMGTFEVRLITFYIMKCHVFMGVVRDRMLLLVMKCLHRSSVWTLGSHMVMLFGEIMRHLDMGSNWEKQGHW